MGNSPSIVGHDCFLAAVGHNSSLIAFKGDPLFGSRSPVYNLNFPVTAAVLTYPQTSEQVADIVRCAVDNGYKVQARSGGHSYANYGLTLCVGSHRFPQSDCGYRSRGYGWRDSR